MKEPEFQAPFREARRLAYSQAVAKLQQGTTAAATTLIKVLLDQQTPASVRVGAARGDTYSSQWEALKGELGRSPQRRGQLEIVGLHEVGG
jgi:hypothetical protein